MPTCPKCRHHFRVMEDEDDGQHGCPSCGYGEHREDVTCIYCSTVIVEEDYDPDVFPYCSAACSINAANEDEELTA